MLLLLSLGVGIAEPSLILLAFLCALTLLVTSIHQVSVSSKIDITVSTAVIFAAILLVGPALTCWAIALGVGLVYVYLKREWFKGAFNTAAYILTAASTGLTYQLTNGGETALLVSWRNTASLGLAAVVYLMLNSWLVAGVVALSEKRDAKDTWAAMLRETAPQYLALILLGILTAIVYGYAWWALVLLVLPLFVVHRSLKANQALREKAKAEEKRRTALQKYVSPRIVQAIMDGKGMPGSMDGGKRMTVLFADIRDFTSLVESTEPTVLMRVLNEYLRYVQLFSGADQSVEVKRTSAELEIEPNAHGVGQDLAVPLGYKCPTFTHAHRLRVKTFSELTDHRLNQLADAFGKGR